jgi:uncharacterized protein YciI
MADPDTRYYAYKLFPPRPSFPADITEAETAIMAEHIDYWTGLLSAGTAVVFGPVADPGGAWGLAVVEADADTDLNQLREHDPVIRRGLGGRVEIYPMPNAIARPANQHPDAVKRHPTGDEPSLG